MVHKHYDVSAAVKLNFNTLSTTRGNKYKIVLCYNGLHFSAICITNCRKVQAIITQHNFLFCSRVVNIWNSLPDSVVDADTLNTFKSCLGRHWLDQDVLYNFHSELTGTGSPSICM